MKGVGPSWVCKTCVRGGVSLQPGHASVRQVGSGSYRQYLLLRRLDREALAVVHVHGASHGGGRRERNALSRGGGRRDARNFYRKNWDNWLFW